MVTITLSHPKVLSRVSCLNSKEWSEYKKVIGAENITDVVVKRGVAFWFGFNIAIHKLPSLFNFESGVKDAAKCLCINKLKRVNVDLLGEHSREK